MIKWLKRSFPFNAEQTVNISSEFGPLVAMFIVNALYNINTGTWALIITTCISIVVMLWVLGRLPVFPLIASGVTISFGVMTLLTGDPMWVQIKVTIFNIMFAIFLFGGLWLKRNFFKHIFDGTFHYTQEGWDKFTWNFAWFFVLTAVANEAVRVGFAEGTHNILGFQMEGINVWILFKVLIVMPAAGAFAMWQTRLMHDYRLPDPASSSATPGPGDGQRSGEPATSKSTQPLDRKNVLPRQSTA